MERAVRCLLVSTLLFACGKPAEVTDGGTLFADLGPTTTSLSGVVYDPEILFFSLATWPHDPGAGEDPPPPLLLNSIPHLSRAALPGALVEVHRDASVVKTSAPTLDNGFWQVPGVELPPEAAVELVVSPPTGEVTLGGDFPPEFTPVPTATYLTTKTMRPLVPQGTYCAAQFAYATGNAGALDAVAKLLTSMGTTTTVDALLDPAITGGVVLVWVTAPSEFFEFLVVPGDGFELTSDIGTVYAMDWAPPGVAGPDQSPMGYIATPTNVSPIGYFAVVLPPGTSSAVTFTTRDTVMSSDPPRPWGTTPFTAGVSPGVSVLRLYAFGDGPPPDPNADPGSPPFDLNWLCQPLE